ncbi:hypothetical protein CLV62_13734 [Dysgonomonas alginatilytica]|uniref:DinB-like domain-containing protein n=1 Tax=Dysgonomonas alginatilytica TaxID=1605892 RepID=A0A2V3PIK2_9BACT|nr:DinB family protein [Dysgonomonas alginatilytica]PXV59368.1 hypothetical protein CLV62_13734 [Dysgonomonas alginatilytica]
MNADFTDITNGIYRTIETWEPVLTDLPIDTIGERKNKQSRTVKQILGHLVDSASNNHQRMVRLQYNRYLEFPDYRQDNDLWIVVQDYQHADWINLVQLWKFYNLHIIHVIKSVDNTKLNNYWNDFEGSRVSLNDMINGYLFHLNFHLNEIEELIE